ncbi:hypothetical protein SmJEL517_g06099 [Synchytrium microbalum]|uniref:VWFA domain-containing protein n=1 Tax=Synchytrium microbalum TaxID=1806994 RepID=A0A507BKD6_9FUNG|nr:uncharacterized protein SmJEL517_g06099 [Synchytrium microbalum]TPX30317.1 hypothetical protein SmJEL517_g06099 [Synchytrium microbalum]
MDSTTTQYIRPLRMVKDDESNWKTNQTIYLFPAGGGNEFCVIQFSGTARMESDFSSDILAVSNSINNMGLMNGGTNVHAALQLVLEKIQMGGSNGRTQVWIVTDGEYNGGDPFNLSQSLRQSGVLTTVLGIGNIHQNGLDLVASFGRAFMAKDFNAAIDLVKSGRTQFEEVNLRASLLKESNRIAGRIPCQVEITNHTRTTIQADTRLIIAEDRKYFEKRQPRIGQTIERDETVTVKFELVPLPQFQCMDFRNALRAFPDSVSMRLVDGTALNANPRVCEKAFCLPLDAFAQDLFDACIPTVTSPRYYIPPVKSYNVSLMGRPGIGKSSFPATLQTALSIYPQPDILNTGRGSRSTHHFTQLPPDPNSPLSKILAVFFDTPGYEGNADATSSDYKGVYLPLLLAGLVPNNTELVRAGLINGMFRLENIEFDQRLPLEESWTRTIHVGVLFIHASSVGSDSLEYERNLAIEWTVKHNRVLLVAITNIDQRSDEEVKGLPAIVSTDIGIDEQYIFPIKNYCALRGNIEKNFDMDKMAFQLCHAILTGGATFLKRWPDTIDRIVKAHEETLNHLQLLPRPAPPQPQAPQTPSRAPEAPQHSYPTPTPTRRSTPTPPMPSQQSAASERAASPTPSWTPEGLPAYNEELAQPGSSSSKNVQVTAATPPANEPPAAPAPAPAVLQPPATSQVSSSAAPLQQQQPMVSLRSRVITAVRKNFKTAATLPNESRLTKHDRDRVEEWIDDYPDCQESKTITAKYLNYFDHNGVPHDEDDFLDAQSGFGLAVNRYLAKLDRATRQLPVVPSVAPSETLSMVDCNEVNENESYTDTDSILDELEYERVDQAS